MAETALAAAAVVSAVAAVGGGVMAYDNAQQGIKAQRQSAALEMQQYEEQRKQAAKDATAQQAASLRDTEATVAALVARRAANGLDPYGGTGRALLDAALDDGAADLETIGANYGRTDRQLAYGSQAVGMRTQGTVNSLRASGNAGLLQAVSGVANSGGRYLSTSKAA